MAGRLTTSRPLKLPLSCGDAASLGHSGSRLASRHGGTGSFLCDRKGCNEAYARDQFNPVRTLYGVSWILYFDPDRASYRQPQTAEELRDCVEHQRHQLHWRA